MTENEQPTAGESNTPAEGYPVSEPRESTGAVEQPLSDTAAIDAAIARSTERFDPTQVPVAATPMDELFAPAADTGEIATAAAVAAAAAAPAPAGWGAEPVVDAAAQAAPTEVAEPVQTVYIQAPVPPKAKGNRLFATAIALIGTGVFTALYAGVTYVFMTVNGAARHFIDFLASPIFWGASAGFFVLYALLGIIINRGPWWVHAVLSVVVGALVYFGVVALTLVAVSAWTLSRAEVLELLRQTWYSPYAITAALIAHEIPIWFGGWIAKNGRYVTSRNAKAMAAYEEEVAAGPVFQ